MFVAFVLILILYFVAMRNSEGVILDFISWKALVIQCEKERFANLKLRH